MFHFIPSANNHNWHCWCTTHAQCLLLNLHYIIVLITKFFTYWLLDSESPTSLLWHGSVIRVSGWNITIDQYVYSNIYYCNIMQYGLQIYTLGNVCCLNVSSIQLLHCTSNWTSGNLDHIYISVFTYIAIWLFILFLLLKPKFPIKFLVTLTNCNKAWTNRTRPLDRPSKILISCFLFWNH